MGYRMKIVLPVKAEESMEETDKKAIAIATDRFQKMGYEFQQPGQVLARLVYTQDEVAVCEHTVEMGWQ